MNKPLYKIVGGGWGNTYGHMVTANKTKDTAVIKPLGGGDNIICQYSQLQKVPHYGA